jgi:NADH-quinone oxidoreductase subunit C
MTDTTASEAAPAAAPEPERLHGCLVSSSRGQRVVHVDRVGYLALLKALVADGYHLCADLCAVDYLTHPGRALPDGIAPERFEVVLNLLSIEKAERLRVRVQVPESDPSLATAFDVWPGTEAMEREAFDMFGIRFDGHPDLTRILMPEDWDGHPLRKDYGVGRIPVQFKAVEGR